MVSSVTRLFFTWLLIFSFQESSAQICSGSLGDPVVDITFGTGGSTGYTATNGYIYTISNCPDDGYYTITKSTTNCFGNTWHNVTSDHTGGGAFMLVNASFNPGDFFVTTVSNLCPNTTYEFAAWIMNVMKRTGAILPDITFRIETPSGTVLGQYSTGDIHDTPTPQWNQYGFYFQTPPNNPVIVLRMTNNAPGGVGNDLALDDITFRPCGEKISAQITGSTDTVDVCEGNSNTYSFSGDASAAYVSPVYFWQKSLDSGKTWTDIPGAVSTSFIRFPELAPGRYCYRLTVVDAAVQGMTACRIASNVLVINVHPKPVVEAGPGRVYLAGYPVALDGSVTGESPSYTWSPNQFISDISILNPEVSPTQNMIYTLSATSSFGCQNKDSTKVVYTAGIFVPSAFTPNGDGKNDTWRIPFLDISFGSEVRVYNRWGQLVYQSEGSRTAWDGTLNGQPLAPDTFVYLVSFKNKFKMLTGTVTLIR